MELRHRPASGPQETLLKARRLVSEEVGIIRLVHEAPIAPDAPRIFGCAALVSDQTDSGLSSDNTICGSTALDRDQAIAGAIGEAIERYSAAYVPYDDIVLGSFLAMGPEAITPWSLVLYGEEQYGSPGFGYRPIAADDVIGWIEGYSLTREAPVFVPAFAVYQPYISKSGEAPVIQQITTGLACGNTPEEAILGAVCEVVERDAAMLMWLQRRHPPRVDFSGSIPSDIARVHQAFGAAARFTRLYDITTDIGIPAYVAVWEGPVSKASGAIFASCAKLDPQRAATGALLELGQCLMWAASLVDSGTSLPDPATKPLSRIEEHVMWPLRPGARNSYAFALDSPERVRLAPIGGPLDAFSAVSTCVRRIAATGLETIIVDVTAPDIRDAGFYVYRAIIPGAQPLFFGSGQHRISQRALGGSGNQALAHRLNLHPHPFP